MPVFEKANRIIYFTYLKISCYPFRVLLNQLTMVLRHYFKFNHITDLFYF